MGLQRHKRRATGFVVAGALSATLLVGNTLAAKAADGAGQGRNANVLSNNATITIELVETPLKNAIRLVEQRTGIDVVVQGGSNLTGTVTLSVKDKPINEILKLMADSAGVDFWEQGNVFYFGPKGSAPKPAAEAVPDRLLPAEPPVASGPKWAVEKIRLLYADPHNICHILGTDNTPMGTMMDIFESQVIHSMLSAQDPNAHPVGSYDSGSQIRSVGEKTRPNNNVVPTAPGNGGFELNPNLNGLSGGAGGGGGQFAGGGGQGFPGGGGQGFPGGGGQGFPGGGQGSGQGQNGQGNGNQTGTAAQLLPDGIQSLLAFSNDGSLLVRYDPAHPEALTELRKIIRLLDVKPRQIQIKTEFVTISQNDIDSFGINFQFQKVNLIGGTNTGYAGTGGQAFLQYATGNLSTQLSFALTTGHAKVVASPLITTLNNMPVSFFVQSLIPVFQSSTVLGNGGQTIVTSSINPIQVQTGLSVVARINGDDSLTVFGAATNYVLGANFTDQNGNSFPNITTQTTPIQRVIRNGDTMVIGGLNQKNDVVNTLKVPLLGDLPFLGNLFRSRNVTTDDKELLIFVTPTILPERVSTAAIGGAGGGAAPAGGGGALPLPGPTP